MATKEITIGTDYTTVPGGRFTKYGPYSGEDFRDNVLTPALRDFAKVIVYLDGTKTYMSSFLEEAFGGLIRVRGFTLPELKSRLHVTAKDPKYSIYVSTVERDLEDADAGRHPARVA